MFYKEKKLEDSSAGKAPEDWQFSKLGEILTLSNGERPTILENGTIPVYGANGIMGYTSKPLAENDFSIIIGRVGASGEVHLGKGKIWISDNAIYSKSYDRKRANLPFLFYLLKFKNLAQFASKTTHPIITQTFLNNFSLKCPPLEEQHKIVKVLSCVDLAIQKTDEVIAKIERLKKGLMQQLLTKGIGHKEFKDTEIGKIPKEWEVVNLGDLSIAEIVLGQSPPSSTYNSERKGLPFLQGKMEFGDIYPQPTTFCSEPAKIAKPNDILLSVRAPVGAVNIAQDRYCIGRGLSAIRPNKTIFSHLFLFYYLRYAERRFSLLSMGSTFKAIRKAEIENFSVPLPTLKEQQLIAEILSTANNTAELERREKTKLERVKLGLMDLLLTGKVRVKVAD